MKKLPTLACTLFALAFSAIAHADTEGISYDYFDVNWALTSIDGLDDSHGAQLGLSVSLADNSYIKLFGSIQDETSNGGLGFGLHHEMIETVDLTAEIGGFYDDVVEDIGAYTELGARWYTCKWFELDAGIGLTYVDSEADFYGVVRAIVPVYKGLSFVASTILEEDAQTYGAGFRLNF